jgi:hypothetical protein
MSRENGGGMNIPICIRDGCETGVIQIGNFRFEIDLGELLTFVEYARLEMRDSLLCNRNSLDNSLLCMKEALQIEMRNSKLPTESDTAKNLKRWQETGCGGYTNLDEAWKAIGQAGGNDFRLPWRRT